MITAITTFIWAIVVLVGLVFAREVALSFARRPVLGADRLKRVESALEAGLQRLDKAEKANQDTAAKVVALDANQAELATRVITVEQRTDPQLARRR